jgi:hypothetical protein
MPRTPMLQVGGGRGCRAAHRIRRAPAILDALPRYPPARPTILQLDPTERDPASPHPLAQLTAKRTGDPPLETLQLRDDRITSRPARGRVQLQAMKTPERLIHRLTPAPQQRQTTNVRRQTLPLPEVRLKDPLPAKELAHKIPLRVLTVRPPLILQQDPRPFQVVLNIHIDVANDKGAASVGPEDVELAHQRDRITNPVGENRQHTLQPPRRFIPMHDLNVVKQPDGSNVEAVYDGRATRSVESVVVTPEVD